MRPPLTSTCEAEYVVLVRGHNRTAQISFIMDNSYKL